MRRPACLRRACFNLCYKTTPAQLGAWMGVLTAVPDSVLWLSRASQAAMQRLREAAQAAQAAQAASVAPERQVFAPRMQRIEDHLARYRLADLFLDTTPYNAHTTASEALLMGLPVLTCRGETSPSRVASSLLYAAGLPELVTHTLDDCVAAALALAQAPNALQVLRACSRRARRPVCSTPRTIAGTWKWPSPPCMPGRRPASHTRLSRCLPWPDE